jgi:hypothetical protein
MLILIFSGAVLVAALTYLINVFVHEFGHFLGGWIAGFKCVEFKVSIFHWVRKGTRPLDAKSRWQSYVRPSVASLKQFRTRYFIFLAGGPVASLAFAIAMWFLWRDLAAQPMVENSLFWSAVQVSAKYSFIISLVHFAFSVVPLELHLPSKLILICSDAAQLAILLVDEPFLSAPLYAAILKNVDFTATRLTTVLDEVEIDRLRKDSEGDYFFPWLAMWRAVDLRDFVTADKLYIRAMRSFENRPEGSERNPLSASLILPFQVLGMLLAAFRANPKDMETVRANQVSLDPGEISVEMAMVDLICTSAKSDDSSISMATARLEDRLKKASVIHSGTFHVPEGLYRNLLSWVQAVLDSEDFAGARLEIQAAIALKASSTGLVEAVVPSGENSAESVLLT